MWAGGRGLRKVLTSIENSDRTSQLEEKIRSGEPVETPLHTSERIIARVTDGIYREPWAAFRELVANAYDADASYVVIETGQPDFERITVHDDGLGMSPATLAHVLRHIGGSSKRTRVGAALNTVDPNDPDLSPGGRPLIGKIGIGLFAVAQLTQHFQIITKARNESRRLSATVLLNTHNEEVSRTGDEEYRAGTVKIVSESVPEKDRGSHGTRVVLYQLRPEIRRTLQSVRRWEETRLPADGTVVRRAPDFHIGYSLNEARIEPKLPWALTNNPREKFDKLFAAIGQSSGPNRQSANLSYLDEYLTLMWKLSLSLPLAYIENHPFDMNGRSGPIFLGIPKKSGQAKEIKLGPEESLRTRLDLMTDKGQECAPFMITLDGVELRRPVRLPGSIVAKGAGRPSRIDRPVLLAVKMNNPFKEADLEIAGGPLSFEAYLYWNRKIIPKETSGVLVRIRNASGTLFDPTFLNYQVSEQTRLRQITAEIFVHQGLDSAVNIDRESFNYSHPHFLYIQRWLHTALRLLANRLKSYADKDLQQERKIIHNRPMETANRIWSKRLGKSADPPISMGTDQAESSDDLMLHYLPDLPDEVGGVELRWPNLGLYTDKSGKLAIRDPIKLTALAIVLEAYGVLSGLNIEDRDALIEDILTVLEIS